MAERTLQMQESMSDLAAELFRFVNKNKNDMKSCVFRLQQDIGGIATSLPWKDRQAFKRVRRTRAPADEQSVPKTEVKTSFAQPRKKRKQHKHSSSSKSAKRHKRKRRKETKHR